LWRGIKFETALKNIGDKARGMAELSVLEKKAGASEFARPFLFRRVCGESFAFESKERNVSGTRVVKKQKI
jgi:hypothetical protein